MGRELGQPIWEVLTEAGSPRASVVTTPLELTTSLDGALRRWRVAWSLNDRPGVTCGVSVEVDESADTVAIVRVGSHVIQGVPPWIERRLAGEIASADEDEEERRAFREAIRRSVQLVIGGYEVPIAS
jgi:hypothetical protein